MLYLLSFKAAKGYWTSSGPMSDAECDYWYNIEREWRKQPKLTDYQARQLFGLLPPSGSVKGDLNKDAIKERSNIIEVYRCLFPGLKVIERGNFTVAQAFCHDDHKPSISLSKAKGLYYCHPCATGGDTINLVEKALNIPFLSALQWLDQNCG